VSHDVSSRVAHGFHFTVDFWFIKVVQIRHIPSIAPFNLAYKIGGSNMDHPVRI
jgi:hypothetical protein